MKRQRRSFATEFKHEAASLVLDNIEVFTGTHTFQETEISPSDTREIFDKFSLTLDGTGA